MNAIFLNHTPQVRSSLGEIVQSSASLSKAGFGSWPLLYLLPKPARSASHLLLERDCGVFGSVPRRKSLRRSAINFGGVSRISRTQWTETGHASTSAIPQHNSDAPVPAYLQANTEAPLPPANATRSGRPASARPLNRRSASAPQSS